MVAYPFTHRNSSHQQLCVISLSYIFCIFQHWNLLETGFFADVFKSEEPLQKSFHQIKVEEDLKFLFAQITLKYSKKRRKTATAPRVFLPREPVLTIPPHLTYLMCKKPTCDAKRVVRDTSELLSSDWSKITFIFCIWSVARLWRSSKICKFGEDEKTCIRKFNHVTYLWLIREQFMTHLRPIPSIYN